MPLVARRYGMTRKTAMLESVQKARAGERRQRSR
jgi:hypothetical protein